MALDKEKIKRIRSNIAVNRSETDVLWLDMHENILELKRIIDDGPSEFDAELILDCVKLVSRETCIRKAEHYLEIAELTGGS
jgi:hypothetical protein